MTHEMAVLGDGLPVHVVVEYIVMVAAKLKVQVRGRYKLDKVGVEADLDVQL